MWFAIAIWFVSPEPMTMHVTQVPFESKSECVEYIVEYSDFNQIVFEEPHRILLDNGTEDKFGIACVTQTVKA